jgi:hypothetical protein
MTVNEQRARLLLDLARCRVEQEAAKLHPPTPAIRLWIHDWFAEEQLILTELKKLENGNNDHSADTDSTPESLLRTEGLPDRSAGDRENHSAQDPSTNP